MFSRFPQGTSLHLLILPILIFGSAGVCRAQPVPAEPPRQERAAVAQRFAEEKLAVWQTRLKLDDWHISVVVAPAAELRQQTVGNVHWVLDKKTAVIRILDPADYHLQWRPMLQDMEFTVVHELIHVQLAPLLSEVNRNEANRREEEYTVN